MNPKLGSVGILVEDVVARAQTGDKLLVHGGDFVQELIEFDTQAPFCHVAVLVIPNPGEVLVTEFVEGTGYQSMTLDDWLSGRPNDFVFFGKAPVIVNQNAGAILADQAKFADPNKDKYDYAALPVVLLSEITGKTFDIKGNVCSLYGQHEDEIAGYPTPGNAAPGDFLYRCQYVAYINR